MQKIEIAGSHPTQLAYYEWQPGAVLTVANTPDTLAAADAQPREDDHANTAQLAEPQLLDDARDGLAPAPRVRAVVQLVHGMVEHLGRYSEFARFLNEQGIVVAGTDHRGHGHSVTKAAPFGDFGAGVRWVDLVDDVARVHDYLAQRYPGAPYFLLGHSMGSFLVRSYILNSARAQQLAGAICVGTGEFPQLAGDMGLALATSLANRAPGTPSELLTWLTFGGYNKGFEHRTKFDWLSRNQENVDRYIADPLCGHVPVNGFFREMLRGVKLINMLRGFAVRSELPILLASGELDPVGGAKAVERIAARYRAAGVRSVTERVYSQDRHEILNEVDREQVWADILAWLTE